jgi:hypothetical protein
MMKRLLQRTCLLAAGLCASGCVVVVPRAAIVPMAAPGVRLRADVSRGYAAYSGALAPYGAWEPDAEHGVRWCPRSDGVGPGGSFQPYVSRGRWGAAEAPVGRAPAGSPVWMSEDSDTWGGVTTRHGWWVHVEPLDGGREWCWIPGAQETAGRVVWRTGDGFVGWAPEAPTADADDDAEYDNLDWVYSLLGTLMDDGTDGNLLTGEARETARNATAPGAGGAQRHAAAPSAAKVGDARKALSTYADLHKVTFAEAVARLPVSVASSSGKASGSSGSSGSGKSSKSDASARTTSTTPKATAAVYYDAMMADPMYMPAGYLPRVPHADGPAPFVSNGHAVGSAASAVHGSSSTSAHAHTSSTAPTYHPSTSSGSSSKRGSSSGRSSSGHSSSSHGHHR